MAKQDKALVIVESPAKAKTIGKYLGTRYQVEASIGHIRDLPNGAKEVPEKYKKEKWSHLGVNVESEFEPVYIIPTEKKKQVKKLKDALKESAELYLATDEDREGEAISWHLREVLKPKVPVHRLVFHEITKEAISDALAHPRVQRAITSGFLRSIAVAYIEFAGPGCTRLSVPWTRIDGPEAAKAFGAAILAQDRMYCPGGNAISEAVAVAADSFETNGFLGTRRVIDVSGDGPNTIGEPMELVRNIIVARGITINGLVIERPTMPDLDIYYRQVITGGPGSFVIKAESRKTFAQAILKKLILEIAGRTPGDRRARR